MHQGRRQGEWGQQQAPIWGSPCCTWGRGTGWCSPVPAFPKPTAGLAHAQVLELHWGIQLSPTLHGAGTTSGAVSQPGNIMGNARPFSYCQGSATAQGTPRHGVTVSLCPGASHCCHRPRNLPPARAAPAAPLPGKVTQSCTEPPRGFLAAPQQLSRAGLSSNNLPVTNWAWPAGIAPSDGAE